MRLRSFSSDEQPYTIETGSLIYFIYSGEEQHLWPLHKYGYCTAVGRPGDRIPSFGFDRWLINEDVPWQEAVADLIRRASLVVCGPGSSDSYLWELTESLREKRPEQVIAFWTENDNLMQDRILQIMSPPGKTIVDLWPILLTLSVFQAKIRIVMKDAKTGYPTFDSISSLPKLAERAGLVANWNEPRSVARTLLELVQPLFKIYFYISCLGEILFLIGMVCYGLYYIFWR